MGNEGCNVSSEDYFNVSQTVITNRHKDNCFNIETNINRIKNICEAQMDGIDSENYYKTKILDEATYDSEKYEDNKFIRIMLVIQI
jgi:hypothetical protein